MAQAGQLIHRHGDVISTFVGWDSLLLASITEGAAGVMAGTVNVMPSQLVSVHRALIEGDLVRARRKWAQIYPLMDAIMSAPLIPSSPPSSRSGSPSAHHASRWPHWIPPVPQRSPI